MYEFLMFSYVATCC